jgi:hypothetical protein
MWPGKVDESSRAVIVVPGLASKQDIKLVIRLISAHGIC